MRGPGHHLKESEPRVEPMRDAGHYLKESEPRVEPVRDAGHYRGAEVRRTNVEPTSVQRRFMGSARQLAGARSSAHWSLAEACAF